MQRLAVAGFEILEIGRKDVVAFPSRKALRELPIMIGVEFPLGFFVLGAADLNFHSVDRAIVRAPNRALNNSCILLGLWLFRNSGIAAHDNCWHKHRNDEQER